MGFSLFLGCFLGALLGFAIGEYPDFTGFLLFWPFCFFGVFVGGVFLANKYDILHPVFLWLVVVVSPVFSVLGRYIPVFSIFAFTVFFVGFSERFALGVCCCGRLELLLFTSAGNAAALRALGLCFLGCFV